MFQSDALAQAQWCGYPPTRQQRQITPQVSPQSEHAQALSEGSTERRIQPTTISEMTFSCDPSSGSPAFGATGEIAAENSIFFRLLIQNCRQRLDHFNWIGSRFEHSTILYKGGPLRLANVLFQNCTFDFADSEVGQRLMQEIQNSRGKAISFYSGGVNKSEKAKNAGNIIVFPREQTAF
jgi:hypothetical protein